jgi:hypothetical protein
MMCITDQKTCASSWAAAAKYLLSCREFRAYTLVLEIQSPNIVSQVDREITGRVSEFLDTHGAQPLSTVVNTIFPAELYARHPTENLFELYKKVHEKIRGHDDYRWGNYFVRMTQRMNKDGTEFNPLLYLIEKLRRQLKVAGPQRAAYELNIIDVFADLPIYEPGNDKHFPVGGPCLSHLSFKLNADRELMLTALYRSHYYITRALGNLLGLAWLQRYVAVQLGLKTGPLICHSTMGILDKVSWSATDLKALVSSLPASLATK